MKVVYVMKVHVCYIWTSLTRLISHDLKIQTVLHSSQISYSELFWYSGNLNVERMSVTYIYAAKQPIVINHWTFETGRRVLTVYLFSNCLMPYFQVNAQLGSTNFLQSNRYI
jgi:hypothetical protein